MKLKPLYTLKTLPKSFAERELIVFDVDGTLTKTKSDLEPAMARAFGVLLTKKKVAVIGGGSCERFKQQLLRELNCPPSALANLFLFPTTAMAFFRYEKGWKRVYSFPLLKEEKASIRKAFKDVFAEIKYVAPKKTYGKTLEDRGTQFTYSFLGQDVVAALGKKGVALKEQWTRENEGLKLKVTSLVQKQLSKFEVHAAGFTSIDVTKKGIDKAYGIREIKKMLNVPVQKMLFVGDALHAGGNDFAARKTSIDCVSVKGPEETRKIINFLNSEN